MTTTTTPSAVNLEDMPSEVYTFETTGHSPTLLPFAIRNILVHTHSVTLPFVVNKPTHPMYFAALMIKSDFLEAFQLLHFDACSTCKKGELKVTLDESVVQFCSNHAEWIKSSCAIYDANIEKFPPNDHDDTESSKMVTSDVIIFQLMAALNRRDDFQSAIQDFETSLVGDKEFSDGFSFILQMSLMTAIVHNEFDMFPLLVESLVRFQIPSNQDTTDQLFQTILVSLGMRHGTVEAVTRLLELEETLSTRPAVHEIGSTNFDISVPMLELIIQHPRLKIMDNDEFIRTCFEGDRADILLIINDATPLDAARVARLIYETGVKVSNLLDILHINAWPSELLAIFNKTFRNGTRSSNLSLLVELVEMQLIDPFDIERRMWEDLMTTDNCARLASHPKTLLIPGLPELYRQKNFVHTLSSRNLRIFEEWTAIVHSKCHKVSLLPSRSASSACL
ncbi:hypothetical protein BC829DRAFT_453743 [Chytridium lagenaria]|nr:hypothetical protein BC829DRAFT_453743 [Chytridium lagenaria]